MSRGRLRSSKSKSGHMRQEKWKKVVVLQVQQSGDDGDNQQTKLFPLSAGILGVLRRV